MLLSLFFFVVPTGSGRGAMARERVVLTPTPRWPDLLVVHDPANRILFSSKLFAAHVATEQAGDLDEGGWEVFGDDWRYYFECMLSPSARQLAREMMSAARAAGATVSIDLASFELVRNCKEALLGLLQEGLVDLIFANEEEALTLCSELGLAGPDASAEEAVEAAQRFLLSGSGGRARVAVTSLGSRGCVARGADGGAGAAPACRVSVVDTIGAGDFFTAGFLTAYLRGGSLQQCCAAGCAAGCEAVQARGAELPPAAFARLNASLGDILATAPLRADADAVAGGAGALAAAMNGSGHEPGSGAVMAGPVAMPVGVLV
ncbi:putative diflavin flavoprotein A 6 [Tetrabaena socialis]|uniref:Putative diflavin flavoprotein A 6 n=1 Tax=Tetrabaena socialis TaxID=47790 RepID=A0A2J8A6L8_9CHLO|nr:putative diflavin flavoprotein A 6 [Tetrabaena socialis]|eukprot:PNH08176.1 putative diflavin flavoprotein A 6 [Tetrabaena socialis]